MNKKKIEVILKSNFTKENFVKFLKKTKTKNIRVFSENCFIYKFLKELFPKEKIYVSFGFFEIGENHFYYSKSFEKYLNFLLEINNNESEAFTIMVKRESIFFLENI